MAKKAKWTEPELPEVKEVEEEIPVEETVVAEPEPEPEPEPTPEPEPEPEPQPAPEKGELVGHVRGRPVYKKS